MNWRDVPMPPTIARLPRDARGFPVPAHVWRPPEWKSGEPLDLRVMNTDHHLRMANARKCAVCEYTLFNKVWFIGGPMCLANRIFGDGGLHRECAEYSLQVCPLLAREGAQYNDRPSTATDHDPNALRTRPPYQVLVQTRGYTVLTHDPVTHVPFPKALLQIDPWDRCQFRVDGQPTTDTYAVITNQRGTALYCFECIGRGIRAISYHPNDVASLYCGSCHRFLADPVAVQA